MSVVVLVEGRKAIPVRAIPLLTDWNAYSPDVIAKVLAGNAGDTNAVGTMSIFGKLQAHRTINGTVQPVPERTWDSWSVRKLDALSEELKSAELGNEVGYQRWRNESLAKLPAGVFVWKDELEAFHDGHWKLRARMFEFSALDDNEDEQDEPLHPSMVAFARNARKDLDRWHDLDFTPLIQPEHRALVMEGFELETVKVPASDSTKKPANTQFQALPDAPQVVSWVGTEWTLTKPKRFQGYTEPLYLLLEAAHNGKKKKPTARDVLQSFEKSLPSQIAKVIAGDGLDYYLANGQTKAANLRAIGAAISGMTAGKVRT